MVRLTNWSLQVRVAKTQFSLYRELDQLKTSLPALDTILLRQITRADSDRIEH